MTQIKMQWLHTPAPPGDSKSEAHNDLVGLNY